MVDLDYGAFRLFPGNYDEYTLKVTQARERLLSDNAAKKAQIAELQTFALVSSLTHLKAVEGNVSC